MKSPGLFVTGTDTGVGKTWVTTGLLRQLRDDRIAAVGMKPIECGGNDDALAILAASSDPELTLQDINQVILPEPVAPAAATTPALIDFDQTLANYKALKSRADVVVVEGAGGWLVPIDRERTMADLAAKLDLPVLIVAANQLGVLNHTLLTLRAIEAADLTCFGVYLNTLPTAEDQSTESNGRVLRKLLKDVPLFEGNIESLARALAS
tara:strand:+ start:2614 stop:3240 length:627 start_codon:yes stop_codon:yes gene_type:complete